MKLRFREPTRVLRERSSRKIFHDIEWLFCSFVGCNESDHAVNLLAHDVDFAEKYSPDLRQVGLAHKFHDYLGSIVAQIPQKDIGSASRTIEPKIDGFNSITHRGLLALAYAI